LVKNYEDKTTIKNILANIALVSNPCPVFMGPDGVHWNVIHFEKIENWMIFHLLLVLLFALVVGQLGWINLGLVFHFLVVVV
jgi:hypothetical protein